MSIRLNLPLTDVKISASLRPNTLDRVPWNEVDEILTRLRMDGSLQRVELKFSSPGMPSWELDPLWLGSKLPKFDEHGTLIAS